MDNPLADFDHPAVRTGLLTAVGYGVVIGVLFVIMFLVPLLVFSLL
ncbi:hypothetical protein [Salinirussus salinus]|jgi:hypothetical protein|nr:hypothetical protein [Salinirussus salinus]